MNKGIAFALGVIVGGVGGGLLANMMLKQTYAQKADEEIAACRKAFLDELSKRRAETEAKEHKEKKEAAEQAIVKYSPEPEKASEIIKKAEEDKKTPYVISPEIYEDPSNPYKSIGMIYFQDGTVLMDDGVINDLDKLDALIGREALTHFGIGESEDDRVCVRNETLGNDYEIIRSYQTYPEYLEGKGTRE